MSERTERDYRQAVDRVVRSAERHVPHAGAEGRALVRALVNALECERKARQYSVRTRVGLTISTCMLRMLSQRLDRQGLYK